MNGTERISANLCEAGHQAAETAAAVSSRMKGHIIEVDWLRAGAIAGVVLFHYWKAFATGSSALLFGWSGVDLFFVISGFVLLLQLERRYLKGGRMQYLPYLRNRFLRIAPAFYASLALEVLFFHRDLLFSGTLLAHLAFVNIVSYKIAFSIQPVYWTLAVEMQFYVFLMAAAALFRGRKGYAALVAVIALSLAYRYAVSALWGYSSHAGLVLINQLPGRLSQFAVGMLAAKLYLGDHQGRLGRPVARSVFLITGAALLALLGRLWLAGGDGIFDSVAVSTLFHPLLGLAFVLIMLALLNQPQRVRRSVILRPVAFLGIISYSLYLWHMFILSVMSDYLNMNGATLHGWIGIVPALAAAIALSVASYYLIEKTFLRFKA